MVILITGESHTGKTSLAQKLLEKKHYPYLSQDHLKMGLIRTSMIPVSPDQPDEDITKFVWPVTREIIKTAVENRQNLIVEGCYIPFNWKSDFEDSYLMDIKYICLCFSDRYIENNFDDIRTYACCIENRLDDDYLSTDLMKRENKRFIDGCNKYGLDFCIIDDDYEAAISKIIEHI